MKLTFLVQITIFMVACSGGEKTQADNIRPAVSKVSVAADPLKKRPPMGNSFPPDSLKSMKHFNIDLHSSYLDSILKNELTLDDSIKGYCWGDACGETKIYASEHYYMKTDFFKHDGGEYGFGNAQYFFIADSLNLVRTFDYSIGEWSTDSSNTFWMQEEKIYELFSEEVRLLERKILCESGSYVDISQIPFKETRIKRSEIYTKLMESYRMYQDLQKQKE